MSTQPGCASLGCQKCMFSHCRTQSWQICKVIVTSNISKHSLRMCNLLIGCKMPALNSQRVPAQYHIESVPQNAETANVNWGIWPKIFKTKHFLNEKSRNLIGCWARVFVFKNGIGQPARRTIMFNSPAHHWILHISTTWVDFGRD